MMGMTMDYGMMNMTSLHAWSLDFSFWASETFLLPFCAFFHCILLHAWASHGFLGWRLGVHCGC